MGAKYQELTKRHIDFIAQQQIFFVATATEDSYINLSPKDSNSLHIINNNELLWLNLTGSGNETAAHLQSNDRMTIMFCAFSGNPSILRLYGNAKTYSNNDKKWADYLSIFPNIAGARQIIHMNITLAVNSCGFGVPKYDFISQRDELNNWAQKKGAAGIKTYQQDKNTLSLNGKKITI